MQDLAVLNLAREAFYVAAVLSVPVLISCLVVGIIVSLLQAVTQVQDQAVSFVPKLLAVSLVLFALGPAALREIASFMGRMLALIGRM